MGQTPITERMGGITRLLEVRLGKPLQWFVCQLHSNELPLRHLMEHLDGPTSGPRGFSGPIGKAIANCELMPVIEFEKTETDLPEVTVTDLSTDQQYLLDISKAIESGNCSSDLERRNPGKISHARWLTLANRLLHLYVGTSKPS